MCEMISQQRVTSSEPSTSPPLYSPLISCSQHLMNGRVKWQRGQMPIAGMHTVISQRRVAKKMVFEGK